MRSTYVSYSSRSAVASPDKTRLISCVSFTGLRDSYAANSIVDLLTTVDGKGLSIGRAPGAAPSPTGGSRSAPGSQKDVRLSYIISTSVPAVPDGTGAGK